MIVSLTANAGETSRAVNGVSSGAVVTLSPVGGYSEIEYTTASGPDIENGAAEWSPWPLGAISAERSDVVQNACAIRIRCYGGSCSALITDERPKASLSDWQSSIRSGPLPAGGIRCILLGDSITNQCYSEYATGQFGIGQAGYFATASLATYGALRLVAELGVSGDTTRNILASAQENIERYRPDLVIVMGGTNDITSAGISAEETISNLMAIARLCHQFGALCAMFTIPPKNTAVDGSAANSATKHAQINWAIQQRIGVLPGVVVADAYSTVVNIANGQWASGMSADGTHPLAAASYRHGVALANAIAPYIPVSYRAPTMAMHQLDGWNLVYNPYMTGNNAAGSNGWTVNTGITGNGPNGYNAARYIGSPTATASKTTEVGTLMQREWARLTVSFVADSDCVVVRSDINQNSVWAGGITPALGTYRRPTARNGYAYRCIVSGTAGGTEPTWPTILGRTIADGSVTWQCVPLVEPGARFVAVAEYKLSSVSGNVSPVMIASCRDAGGAVIADMIGNRRATAEVLPDSFIDNGVIWTPEFITPETVNRIQVNCGIYGSAGGSAVFDVTGMQLIKIPEGFEVQELLTD